MGKHLSLFLLALGFLTRIPSARVASVEDMRSACVYFPLVGLVLGILLTLPFWVCGLFASTPFIQAFIYIVASAWLTRALHLDGLADVCDALGSGKQNEEFHAILKDSRLGAFGAVGLILFLCGQLLFVATCFAIPPSSHISALAPLVFAPVLGRCMPICLAAITQPHPKAQLGTILSHAPQKPCLIVACVFALLLGSFCLTLLPTLLALIFCALSLLYLSRTAAKHGGYNGDFLGCAILAGEMSALVAAVIAG